MNLEDIRKRVMNGFRPFVIRASDGREFRVPHREFIFLTKRSVIIADEEGFVDILDPIAHHFAARGRRSSCEVNPRNLEECELTPEGNVRQQARHRAEREKLQKFALPPQMDLFGS